MMSAIMMESGGEPIFRQAMHRLVLGAGSYARISQVPERMEGLWVPLTKV
jgi:hypothetical protein